MFRSLMPGVPLSIDRIMKVVSDTLMTPTPFTGIVTVEGRSDKGLIRTSNLLILSPEEFCHAYLLAIDDSITRGDSEDILQQWKKHCLSVCFEYVDISGNGDNQSFWWSWNHREQHCVSADAIKRTAYQRACEVHEFKVNLDKSKSSSSPEAIAALYSEAAHIKKHIDVSWVRMCLNVYDKICSNPEITAVVDRLEKKFGIDSCLNSMTKLVKIAEKTDTLTQRVLVFHAIEDAIDRGIHNNTKFTREFLIGGGKEGGNSVPFVTMVIFKWRIRNHLLTVEMPKEKMDPQDLQKITDMTADYATYRRYIDVENTSADTTWIGAMHPSSVSALRVIQDARALLTYNIISHHVLVMYLMYLYFIMSFYNALDIINGHLTLVYVLFNIPICPFTIENQCCIYQ